SPPPIIASTPDEFDSPDQQEREQTPPHHIPPCRRRTTKTPTVRQARIGENVNRPDRQGERILIVLISGQSRLKELEKVGVVPTGQLALGLDAALVGALALGEVQGDLAEQGEVFGPVVGSDA